MRCYLLCKVLAVLVPAAIGPCRHGFRKPAAGRLATSGQEWNGMDQGLSMAVPYQLRHFKAIDSGDMPDMPLHRPLCMVGTSN